MINLIVGSEVNLHGTPALAAAEAARAAGSSPSGVLAAAAALVGPRRVDGARQAVRELIDRFAAAGLKNELDEAFDLGRVSDDTAARALLVRTEPDAKAEQMLAALHARGARSVFLRYLENLGGYPTADAVLAAATTTLAWGPLMRKRVSRLTVESLPWWVQVFGTLIGASVPAERHEPDRFCGMPNAEILAARSLTEVACAALLGEAAPTCSHLFVFQTLVGLLLSNGPGTISAQGAKGAVAADGPEMPQRVQLNKAVIGFLSHTGFAHGGNGYEGIAFLVDQFRDTGLADPGDPEHGIDLKALAARYAAEYADYRSSKRAAGSLDLQMIPGVNHPVFRDKPVNYDPREVWVRELFTQRGEYNAFHEYYRALVEALHKAKVSRNVYCVNIDAVISALLLKILWRPYCTGALSSGALETAAFTIFLYARMLGCAAEIDDHLNRGRNMDTRTPASQCRFVA